MTPTTNGNLVQINVNPRGGVPKYPVPSAELTTLGVVGDRQRNLRFHGGPERAVCLYALERIMALQSEGHTISPGTTGENLTLSGLDWAQLKLGDRLLVGEVELELTSYAAPCSQIEGSFVDGHYKRISEKVQPGWSRLYARVISEGVVHVGDRVEHLPR